MDIEENPEKNKRKTRVGGKKEESREQKENKGERES